MNDRYDSRTTFVPALREPDPPRPAYMEPVDLATLPPAAQTTVELRTDYVDRAKGFSVATAPLAASAGFVAALVAIVGFAIPVVSLATLLAALGGFCATWLAAWVIHTLVSPDGIAMLHTLAGWRYLYREQAERHRRYRG